MSAHVYHYVWHTTTDDGRIISRHETNDDNDNDDGWPDEIASWTVGPQPKELALKSPYDRSHIGCGGVYVYVYLDGKELT